MVTLELESIRVAPHKKGRCLDLIEQVPKTASGKLLRRVLVERARAAVRARPPGR